MRTPNVSFSNPSRAPRVPAAVCFNRVMCPSPAAEHANHCPLTTRSPPAAAAAPPKRAPSTKSSSSSANLFDDDDDEKMPMASSPRRPVADPYGSPAAANAAERISIGHIGRHLRLDNKTVRHPAPLSATCPWPPPHRAKFNASQGCLRQHFHFLPSWFKPLRPQ